MNVELPPGPSLSTPISTASRYRFSWLLIQFLKPRIFPPRSQQSLSMKQARSSLMNSSATGRDSPCPAAPPENPHPSECGEIILHSSESRRQNTLPALVPTASWLAIGQRHIQLTWPATDRNQSAPSSLRKFRRRDEFPVQPALPASQSCRDWESNYFLDLPRKCGTQSRAREAARLPA